MKQVSLFIFSSKSRLYLGRIVGALVFLLCFFGIEKGLEFVLINDTNEWSRAMFHDFYTREENIDTLFLGSSHVYCGINPAVIAEKTGKSTFNMATPAQPLNGSYYLLKEAVKYHDISHVYLELYFGQSVGEEGHFKEEEQLPRNWRNTNYMKPSFNKLAYMLSMSEPSLAYMTFLPARRYWTDVFEPEKIKETIRQKCSRAYREYEVENELNGVKETYVKDGFYHSEHKAKGGVLYDIIRPEPFTAASMTAEAEEYLRKILEFCREKQIALTLFSVPVTDYQASLYGEYDLYVEQVREIAEEYGQTYYDFNLCRKELLDLTDDGLFRDKGHLNVWGAERFSACFSNVFEGLETGTMTYEQCFYPSYKEKLAEGKQRIFGLLVEKEEKGEKNGYTVTPIHNLRETKIEYFVYTKTAEGAENVLADWTAAGDPSGSFRFTTEKTDQTVYIEARPEGERKGTNFVQIK